MNEELKAAYWLMILAAFVAVLIFVHAMTHPYPHHINEKTIPVEVKQ